MSQFVNEPMLEMYLFETTQMIEQLELAVLASEKEGFYAEDSINEIFRFMHTIKGSSAMMLYNDIAALAHSMEDVFYFLREAKPTLVDYSILSDIVFEGVDFIKVELAKIKGGDSADGDSSVLIEKIKEFMLYLKSENPSGQTIKVDEPNKQQKYYIAPEKKITYDAKNFFKAVVYFEEGCEMESIRAYTIIHNLKDLAEELFSTPEVGSGSDSDSEFIKENGFIIYIRTNLNYEKIESFLEETIFLKELKLEEITDEETFLSFKSTEGTIFEEKEIKMPQMMEKRVSYEPINKEQNNKEVVSSGPQSVISVNVDKLDKLMDLVGEMVISEAMVTQNPDVVELELENFTKAARLLHKITSEIQDTVMSIRMVPLSTTFMKMQRIMRDMCKKLEREVELQLIGEETEVDKNIIEHIADPLMHLIRNAVDHGIEENDERIKKGKDRIGTVTLEAKNAGSDVLVIVRDDGKGLDKERILAKAIKAGLVDETTVLTDREIYNLILLPGFSTNENITEFSGRGVGMDVVSKNLQLVGGTILVDSTFGEGTCMTMKIPLTLAIIDGMNVKVGDSCYTIPITTIKQSFRPKAGECFVDPDGNEMIMVRGNCHPVLRLHKYFDVKTTVKEFHEGVLIMVEQDARMICLFADELIGQQQVVVKSLPHYIKQTRNIQSLSGCTLLGDGSISLIIDIVGLTQSRTK